VKITLWRRSDVAAVLDDASPQAWHALASDLHGNPHTLVVSDRIFDLFAAMLKRRYERRVLRHERRIMAIRSERSPS
jgi:hypothetical protein